MQLHVAIGYISSYLTLRAMHVPAGHQTNFEYLQIKLLKL